MHKIVQSRPDTILSVNMGC